MYFVTLEVEIVYLLTHKNKRFSSHIIFQVNTHLKFNRIENENNINVEYKLYTFALLYL